MKKNNGLNAVLIVNAVVFSVLALSTYHSQLEKYAEQYVKVKKKAKGKSKNYKVETKQILKEASKAIGSLDALAEEALETYDICSINSKDLVSEEIHSYLVEKIESLPVMIANSDQIMLIPTNKPNMSPINITKPIMSNQAKELPSLDMSNYSEAISLNEFDNPFKSWFSRGSIGTLALIIMLNSIGFEKIAEGVKSIDISKEAIESTIEDIEEFFVDTMDTVLTFNDHDEMVERKVNRIAVSEATDYEKINAIFELNDLSQKEKIDNTLHLEGISYTTKFDYFINSQIFTLEEAIDIIIKSNITTFTNVADYIMNIPTISLDEKVDFILNSNLTEYTTIFDYLLDNPKIGKTEGIDYVINSSIANYDELFDYFMKKDYSTYEKVWITLQIPNVSFEDVFNDLLEEDAIPQKDVITSIMKTDLISFNKLFDNIQKIDSIDANELINYLAYYNTYYNNGFNTIELNDLINYSMNISIFSYEDKVECFWNLLEGKDLIEKENYILEYFNLDKKEFVELYAGARKNITEDQNMLLDLMAKVYAIKLDYVLTHYGITLDQLKEVYAGCAAESFTDYDDIYWVINTIFNRITHPWYSKIGMNPYEQFIAPRQFSVYGGKQYLTFLYPSDARHETQYHRAEIPVLDMLYLGYDGIEHNYYEFRSWSVTSFSDNYVVARGNRYNKELKDEDRIIYESLLRDENPEKTTSKERKLSAVK